MNAADQLRPLEQLHLDAAEPDVEACLARIEHLVAGLDAVGSGPTAVTMPVRHASQRLPTRAG